MYYLLACFFFPFINGMIMVKIHRSAVFLPSSDCAFLRNATWPTDASIQSCIWECAHEDHCQTAVYFDDENICSLFTESCQSHSYPPPPPIFKRASFAIEIIQVNHCFVRLLMNFFVLVSFNTCLSTVTSDQRKCFV